MNDEDQFLNNYYASKSNNARPNVSRKKNEQRGAGGGNAMWMLQKALLITTWILLGGGSIYGGMYYMEYSENVKKAKQAESDAKIEQFRKQQLQNEAQVQQDRIKAEQQQQLVLQEKQRQQQALIEKISQAEGDNKSKQAKWELFYKKSPLCTDPKTWDQQVQCANERLKAEQQFEALYNTGKL